MSQILRSAEHDGSQHGASGWSVVPVSGLAGLGVHEQTWRAALDEAATERLFLEPEWVLPWLEAFDKRPRALFAYQDGKARAAAIFVAERLGPSETGPRVLRPPGMGVSDYLDVLLPEERGTAQAAVDVLLDWLLETGGWELLDLPNLPAEYPTAALVGRAASKRGLRSLRLAGHARPYVELKGGWAGYLAARPQKLRYNLRARRRQLNALGELRYHRASDPAQVAGLLPRAEALHARRWRGQYTSTPFSSLPAAGRFYAQAAPRMAARGLLELSYVELDGWMLAFSLNFRHGKRLYYYLPAFEPEYARYAPATELLAHLIERSYEDGIEELDLMLGDEAYKSQWASGTRGTTRLVLAAPGPRGRLALAGFQAYLAGRQRARESTLAQRARRYGLGRLRSAIQAARRSWGPPV